VAQAAVPSLDQKTPLPSIPPALASQGQWWRPRLLLVRRKARRFKSSRTKVRCRGRLFPDRALPACHAMWDHLLDWRLACVARGHCCPQTATAPSRAVAVPSGAGPCQSHALATQIQSPTFAGGEEKSYFATKRTTRRVRTLPGPRARGTGA